jgi:hypothetical protein
MIKQILLCTIFACGLSFAMESDTAQEAARQKELNEQTELNPHPFQRTCGLFFLNALYTCGNLVAGAQQLPTSTHMFDVARVDWLAEHTNEYINGVPFIYSYIAICDIEMLVKAIRQLSKKYPGFYFVHSNMPLDGSPVFAAGTPLGTAQINLKTIADKLKERSKENIKLTMYADMQGSFLTGQLPALMDKDTELKNSLKQWLTATK